MPYSKIVSHLPYQAPFLFVDTLESISEDGVKGSYTLKQDEYFYEGHFKNHPITPGVILTEIMAQIGVVCLGMFLIQSSIQDNSTPTIALTSSAVDFFHAVLPGEKVTVVSKKIYFRFNKLKCHVQLFNERNELVCRGDIAGMFKLKT